MSCEVLNILSPVKIRKAPKTNRIHENDMTSAAPSADQDGAEHNHAEDAPEQHPVLVDARNAEEGEDRGDDEDVVHREGLLDQIAGEEFEPATAIPAPTRPRRRRQTRSPRIRHRAGNSPSPDLLLPSVQEAEIENAEGLSPPKRRPARNRHGRAEKRCGKWKDWITSIAGPRMQLQRMAPTSRRVASPEGPGAGAAELVLNGGRVQAPARMNLFCNQLAAQGRTDAQHQGHPDRQLPCRRRGGRRHRGRRGAAARRHALGAVALHRQRPDAPQLRAERAAGRRLPPREPAGAAQAPGRADGLHHHGAGRYAAHVGLELHLRRHRAARHRHHADGRAGDTFEA